LQGAREGAAVVGLGRPIRMGLGNWGEENKPGSGGEVARREGGVEEVPSRRRGGAPEQPSRRPGAGGVRRVSRPPGASGAGSFGGSQRRRVLTRGREAGSLAAWWAWA